MTGLMRGDIVWQPHVMTTDRPTLPVHRLVPFLAQRPQGVPPVVFDVTFPCPLRDFVQAPSKVLNLECTVHVAYIKGRRTEATRSMERSGGYLGVGSVFYEEDAYHSRAWDSTHDKVNCRVRIDVEAEAETSWGDFWKWTKGRKQGSLDPDLRSVENVQSPGVDLDKFGVQLRNPVAAPGVRHMPGQDSIVVPFVRPKPVLSWLDRNGETNDRSERMKSEKKTMLMEEEWKEAEEYHDTDWELIEMDTVR
nr:hypothetical protein CFP56_50778 [Quercus suber]